MNYIRSFAMLCVASVAAQAWAAKPITVDSKITDVTVYPDRAQVTRSADINVNPGENRLLIDHLPAILAEDSVKAAGKAPLQVIVQDVAVRTVVREQSPDTKTAELEKRVEDLHDEREALGSRQRVIDQQRLLLQQIQVKAAGDVSRDIQLNKFDVTQMKDLPAFVGSEFARLEDDTRQVAVERRELDRKIAAAEAEFGKYPTAANRAEKSVLVTISAKEATKLQLQISYVLGNASWVPAYDARAAVDASGVELTYNAVVRQQTGEDWLGVNLALSTAKPSVSAQMPDLNKWTVAILEPVPAAAHTGPGSSGEIRRSQYTNGPHGRHRNAPRVTADPQGRSSTSPGRTGYDRRDVSCSPSGGCARRRRTSSPNDHGCIAAGCLPV